MFDCNDDMKDYHDEKVTLPTDERTEMRDRRDSNRDRLRSGLKKNDKPAPAEIGSQGSYAMRTMVQHPKKDYDIDDGVYFERSKLVDSDGVDMTPEAARQMVCDAVKDDRFKRQPEVRESCVRVFYNEGYHIDLPVYRQFEKSDGTTAFELAAGSSWKASDARAVTDWFEEQNKLLSPDDENGRQFRRIVRLAKKFTRSRDSWGTKAGSGLMMTKLCTEEFRANLGHDDVALRRTLEGVRDRLKSNLVVKHPVITTDTITKGSDDPKATFLRDKLEEHLKSLDVLDNSDCDHPKALRAWADFFNDGWFRDRAKDSEKSGANSKAPEIVFGTRSSGAPAVEKDGGGKYA